MIILIKFFRYETIETNDGLFLMLIILFIAGAGVDNDANHSVPEWIWIKGSYLSQWLPQGERGPPKESK